MRVRNRRGTVSISMTAQDIISTAVNVVQNRLDEVERDSEDSSIDGLRYVRNDAVKPMLRQVYELLMDANRRAVEQRQAKGARQR
ncbi:MAG: hypothetical protein E6J43_12985 [Chloroflexi bacterium]|nr:MAG: hypothetical protein E6J43_12985 [Chloroflexota bacterium]